MYKGIIHKVLSEVTIPFLPWQGTLQIKRGNKLFLSKPFTPFLFTTIYLSDKFYILPHFLFSFPCFPFFHHLLDLCLSPPPLAVPADPLLDVDSSHPKLPDMLSGQHPEDTNKTVLWHSVLSELIFKVHFFFYSNSIPNKICTEQVTWMNLVCRLWGQSEITVSSGGQPLPPVLVPRHWTRLQ